MSRNLNRDEPTEGIFLTGETVANGTSVITIAVESNAYVALAPAGVTVSTIAKWMVVQDNGTVYYVPMWS